MWTRLRAEASLAADDLRPRSSPEWALAVFGLTATALIAGYLLVWLAAGIVPLAAALAAAAVGGETGVRALGLGLVAAATLWAFAPARHRAVRRCRRTPALAATGPRADRDCLGFG